MLQQSFVSGSGGDTYCRQAWAVLSVKGAVIDEKKSAQTGEDDIIKKQEVKSAEEGADCSEAAPRCAPKARIKRARAAGSSLGVLPESMRHKRRAGSRCLTVPAAEPCPLCALLKEGTRRCPLFARAQLAPIICARAFCFFRTGDDKLTGIEPLSVLIG